MARMMPSLVISWNARRLIGHLGVQHLEKVPRDGLSLAVLICCEVDLGRVLELRLDLGDDLLLLRAHHVKRREAVVDVDGKLADAALALVGGKLARLREVADVADARDHLVVVSQVAADGARLSG